MNNDWISLRIQKPPLELLVETKIDDSKGVRNIQNMRLGGQYGTLWFCKDGCYVYYEPTHWRPLSEY